MNQKISNDFDALVLGLKLAVTAQTDEQAERAIEMAEKICAGMSEIDVARAKRQAEKELSDEMGV